MALNNKLFGQHLASFIILKTVTRHMKNPDPKKPLVLSLHGLTGTGKSFASRMIAESIYRNGMQSKFVHLFKATEHFAHKAHLAIYQDQLKLWVKGNVSECPSSMFIFDEMDQMPTGLIDSIKPYLDYQENIDGVSYGQAIFIFMSQSGGVEIAKVARNFHMAGRKREQIKLMHVEKHVTLSVFNDENSGSKCSSLINEKVVDFYVPFLPLNHTHVVLCLLVEVGARGMRLDNVMVTRMSTLAWTLSPEQTLFPDGGCKMASAQLKLYLLGQKLVQEARKMGRKRSYSNS